MCARVLSQRQLGHFDPTFGAFNPMNKLQRAIKEPIDEVAKRIVDRFSAVELGIDAVRYSKISRIAPYPIIGSYVTKPDDVITAETLQSNYTQSNAWTCYDFALEMILRWQEMGL
jgi:hypothetical protein